LFRCQRPQLSPAKRMDTTQSVITRLENGRTLERLAAATGTRLRISFELDARV